MRVNDGDSHIGGRRPAPGSGRRRGDRGGRQPVGSSASGTIGAGAVDPLAVPGPLAARK
jgi:hypothetical protein